MTGGVRFRCDDCGHEFPGGFYLGPGSSNITIRNHTHECPRPGCGGTGRQLANVVVSVDDAGRWRLVHALRPEGVTLGDYERALEAIRAGQARGASPDQIARDVATVAPRLAGLAPFLNQYGGVIALLSLLVTIIGVIRDFTDSGSAPAPAPTITVNQTVEVNVPPLSDEQLRRLIDEELDRPGPPAVQERTSPPGRNQPCPCGSGRKYKHCHGSRKGG